MKNEKASAGKQPATKIVKAIISLLKNSLKRKPCRCAPDLWQAVADLCILLRQHESAQTDILVQIHEAADHLERLEPRLWAMRAEAERP